MAQADKAGNARRQAITLLMQLMRRAIDSTRSYGRGHPLSTAALQRLREHFGAVLQTEELNLEVTLNGLTFDGELVGGKVGQRDPMTMPLFNEGIRRITFGAAPPDHERDAFFDAWMNVVMNPQETEALSTRCWELELQSIHLVVLDTFSLTDEEGDENATSQKQAKEELDALINAMASESASAGGDVGPMLLRVSADDVALLRSELVRGVTGEKLAQQDAKLASLHLSSTDMENFAEGINPRQGAVTRGARALLNAAVLSASPELEGFFRRLADVFRNLAERGIFRPTLDAYQALISDARDDSQLGQTRVKLLAALKNFFVSPAFIDPLLKTLDATEGNAPDALEALKVIAPSLGAGFKDQVARLTNANARAAAAGLLVELSPAQGTLAVNVADLNAASFAEFLKRLDTMAPPDAARLLAQGLEHKEVEVRRLAANALTPTLAPRLPRGVLSAHLSDEDEAVRTRLLRLSVELEDPSVARALGKLLERPDVGDEERTRVYSALGKLGGKAATEVLLVELEKRHDPDVTVACIGALAVLGDSAAKKPLEALSHKLMATPRVKAAARAALSRVSKP
ncbi:MAG: hypothetical protein AB1938_15155 [Myxococcota bacterium]